MKTKNLINHIKNFKKVNIAIIGDIILDSYLYGSVDRISPEAPVPIFKFQKQEYRLGGASNVAYNIASLGGQISMAGIIGNDNDGKLVQKILNEKKINTKLLFFSKRKTSIKTRIVTKQQQLLRIDNEDTKALNDQEINSFFKKATPYIKKSNALIISDYGKGVINQKTFNKIKNTINQEKIYTAIDPKKKNFSIYKDIDIMTPNHKEAKENIELPFNTDKEVLENGPKIIKKHNLKELLLTRGKKGMVLFDKKKKPILIPTYAKAIYDVSGAGDTVIAVFTLAKAVGATSKEAAILANLAASIVISKFGTTTLNTKELLEVI